MDNQHVLPEPSTSSEAFNFMDFLTFKRMITLQVIPIMYAIVAVIITLGSLVMMFSGNSHSDYGGSFSIMPGGFLGGLIFLIIGNIGWRMWCEFIIVLFRVNKNLQDIERNTRM